MLEPISVMGAIKRVLILGILCAVRLKVSKGVREEWLLIFTESLIFCGMFCFPVFSNMKNYSSQCKILLFVRNRNSQKKKLLKTMKRGTFLAGNSNIQRVLAFQSEISQSLETRIAHLCGHGKCSVGSPDPQRCP